MENSENNGSLNENENSDINSSKKSNAKDEGVEFNFESSKNEGPHKIFLLDHFLIDNKKDKFINLNNITSSFDNYIDFNLLKDTTNFEISKEWGTSIDTQLRLTAEITDLKQKLKKLVDQLKDAKTERTNKISELEILKNEISVKERLSHILSRISEKGRVKLLESNEFQKLFSNGSVCEAVVLSIDIRRSTELMLKARSPELFSNFITGLSNKLSQIIMANFGVFDKFTGDGILAFFPKFYSGNEAIIRAVKVALQCHAVFDEHYNNSRHCFNVFIKDIGLGIGIDFGSVTLVNSNSELTVVGIPVVYACRFSGAKAGETLINQPAKEEILKLCPTLAYFKESEISIKNEGTALGYNVILNESAFNLDIPNWDDLIEQYKT